MLTESDWKNLCEAVTEIESDLTFSHLPLPGGGDDSQARVAFS